MIYGFVAGLLVLVGLPTNAFADTITGPGSPAATTINTVVGSTASPVFTLTATKDANEASVLCNASNGNKAELTFTVPAAVKVSPSKSTFSNCAETKSPQFSSDVPGTYTITPVVTPAGIATAPAPFTLVVGPAPIAAVATTLALATATGVYTDVAVDLKATLRSGTTAVANKLVNFSVAGVAVGSSATNASGVATLSVALNQTKQVGTYATSASFQADSNYLASSQNQPTGLTVSKASQSITFVQPGNTTFGTAAYTVPSSASSGLMTALASTTAPVCTVSGSTVTLVAAGTCTLTATQAGDGNWTAAVSLSRSFDVAKASQTVSLGLSRYSATFNDQLATTVSASASSGLTVSTSVTSGPCTLSGTSLTATGAGTCVVTGSQAGNGNYNAATSQTQNLAVGKADQSVTFDELAAKTFGDAAFDVSATASSNLSVAFTAAPAGVCSFDAGKVTVNGAGQCTVTARQAGNANFNSAPDFVRTFAVNKAAQTITFEPLAGKTFGDVAFEVTATATGGPVTFSAKGACDVAGATVTITGAGDCTVTAAQGGNANYEAATSVARTFTVARAPQTITLPVLVDRTYPVTTPIVTGASSSSDLTVAVSAGPSAVCTASGGSVTITGAGICDVTASQAGNANFLPAAPVDQSFTVAKAKQSITFDALDPQTFGVAAFALNAVASSGLDVGFTSTTPLVCIVEAGPKLAVNTAGTCTVVASQDGDGNYNPAVNMTRTFAVAKSGQSISLAIGQPTATFGDASRVIDASATSMLTVALSMSGPCTVSGTTLTITGAGTCVVNADQAGNGNYNAAARETATLNVAKANQEISFPELTDKTFGDAPLSLTATVNSPLTVTYSTSDASVCTVTGARLTVVGAGECTVTAKQAGNENYNSAGDVARAFTVAKAAQTIDFAALTDKTFGNAPFALTATATSGETVTFSATATGDCTVAGTTVTITGAGSCTITADQGGAANYLAATSVPRTFTIAKAPQTITFGTLLAKTFGDDSFTVSAGTSSGLSAAFASATSTVCTVTDSTVAIVAAGTCTVVASQRGDGNYLAAASVPQSFVVAKKDQTIDFEQPLAQTFGAAAFELRANASSALAVTFTASPEDVCTVSVKTVTITGAGPCTLMAAQAGNGNFNAAPTSSLTVVVSKSGQTIAVTVDSATPTFGDGPVTVTASSTSRLPVVLTSTGPCRLETATATGTPLILTGAGNCTVFANQMGDRNYLPAEQQESVVAIGKADQTVLFAALGGKTFGDAPVALTATAGSGLRVTYVATTTSVCSIEVTAAGASTVKINGAGDCTVTAGQEGDVNYNAAADVPQSFTVAKADQTVTFAALANKTFGDADFTLGATASSGRTITYGTTGPCTVGAGASLSITGAGTCAVTASQVGNSNYNAAPPVTQSFAIAKAAQTITFDVLPVKTYGDDGFAVTASSTSGLAVTVSSITTGVCTVGTAGITIKSAGTCTLTASQAGNANYNAATSVNQSFAVAKAGLTVTGPAVSKVLGAANPTLTPSYSGFVYSDNAASLTTPATCTTAATATSPVGAYDVTCSGATSGNYTFTYPKGQLTVVYKYSGLLQPINADRSSAFKSGSTIPVKWQVLDNAGVVQDAGTLRTTIRVTKTGAASAPASNETAVTLPGDASAAFRWDATGKLYIYNLSTKTWAMGEGTYRIDVISATGQVLTTGGIQVKA